jgi:hypothetical protein
MVRQSGVRDPKFQDCRDTAIDSKALPFVPEAEPMASAPAAGWEHVSPRPDGTAKPLHFFKVASVSCPIAASVVCAAFNPSRKSLSEYAEYLSVA